MCARTAHIRESLLLYSTSTLFNEMRNELHTFIPFKRLIVIEKNAFHRIVLCSEQKMHQELFISIRKSKRDGYKSLSALLPNPIRS
jgi:hypothetical protein